MRSVRGKAILPNEAALQGNQLIDTARRQVQQPVQLIAPKRLVLGRPLHLDQASSAGHDDVHVDLTGRILLVAQIEERLFGDDPDARRRHKIPQRNHRNKAVRTQMLEGIENREKTPSDRCRPRPPIGLYDIAIDPYGALPEQLKIHHCPQRTADQALDFMRPPSDPPPR
jgi:hypothetical protein